MGKLKKLSCYCLGIYCNLKHICRRFTEKQNVEAADEKKICNCDPESRSLWLHPNDEE